MEYTADALQLLVALVWGWQRSDRLGLRYGICGDHRFGKYHVYPVISVNWKPHPDWIIEFGFPTSQVSHQVTKSLTSLLRIVPLAASSSTCDAENGRTPSSSRLK